MDDQTKDKMKQNLKKYAVFLLMAIVCTGSMWLIFAPSKADKAEEQIGMGYNTDIPDPKKDEIIGDKKDAYEQEQMKEEQKQRMQSLQGYANMLENSSNNTQHENLSLINEPESILTTKRDKKAAINNSVSAYQDINKTLGNFYEKPKDDPEKKELKQRLEELEAKIGEKDNKKSAMDDQLALMEKSYEMAAKYMPQSQNQEGLFQNQASENKSLSKRIVKGSANSNNGKTEVSPIKQVREQTVSALAQPVSNEDLFVQYDQPRNLGFNTMDAKEGVTEKNTISAIIDNDQTVIDGQSVRLRLTESLIAGSLLFPENTIITGMAKIQGERLDIVISNMEYQGTIIPVEISVFDTDGQKGIYIPGSLEMNAIKEVAANMGQSVGSSFTMTQSAGAQLASDLSKGAIQGISAYMQKKIKQVKVTLKTGYRVMLMPKQ